MARWPGSVSTPRTSLSGGRCSPLHKAVDTELTPRQRKVFVAIVLDDVPPDALVLSLSSSRNAIYKVLFDARRKLRPPLLLTGIYPMTLRGAHERLAGAGPLLAD